MVKKLLLVILMSMLIPHAGFSQKISTIKSVKTQKKDSSDKTGSESMAKSTKSEVSKTVKNRPIITEHHKKSKKHSDKK